jgi:hypothetical protein
LSLEEFSELYCNECKGQEVEECTELALEEVAIYDVDGNNLIDQAEFETIYDTHYTEEGSQYHREYLFALFDGDKDHNLSLAEYRQFYCLAIFAETDIGDCTLWAQGLFHAYDSDHDDLLSVYEFSTLHSIFCPCPKTVEELWAEYDTN